MMKKTLAILVIGAAIGAVAYAVWYRVHKQDKVVKGDCEDKINNYHLEDFVSVVADKTTVEADVDTTKSAVVSDIAARHEEAARIMKDAVNIIYKRSEVAEDENNKLEQISNNLDDLLSEG